VPGRSTCPDTFAKVPLWGLGIYIVFFGGMPYMILQALERGVTRRQLWQWVGILFVVDVAVEIPILARHMYVYYADPPFDVAGFPLYWLFINVGGPFEVAVLLYAARHLFTGWRAIYLVALPMVCNAASSIAVGWPIYSALNAQAAEPVKWVAGAITIAIGYAVLDLTISWAARKSGTGGQPDPDPHRDPAGPARRHEDRGDRRCGSVTKYHLGRRSDSRNTRRAGLVRFPAGGCTRFTF